MLIKQLIFLTKEKWQENMNNQFMEEEMQLAINVQKDFDPSQ